MTVPMSDPVRAAVLLVLAVTVAGCSKPPAPTPPAAGGPGAVAGPGASESYPDARKQFQTMLVRHGPAPQRFAPLEVPPDVAVVRYESGGRRLTAWVSKAATVKGTEKPAVLFLHGGFAFGEDDWDQTEPLRAAGFQVMVPLLRGENGQPGDFTLHVGEVDDALAAGELLATLPGVDGKNLFVSGHSIGGTLAMFVALASDKFRGAAPISGAPDCRKHLDGQLALAPFDTSIPREFDIRSPATFAKHFRCPVRCYFGTAEEFFRDDTRAMAAAATAAGKDVKAVMLPGNHGTVVEPALAAAATFFREHVTR